MVQYLKHLLILYGRHGEHTMHSERQVLNTLWLYERYLLRVTFVARCAATCNV